MRLGTDLDSDFLLVRLCTGKTEVHLYTNIWEAEKKEETLREKRAWYILSCEPHEG